MSPTHCDIMADIIPFLSHDILHEWGSNMDYFPCYDETTTTFTIQK